MPAEMPAMQPMLSAIEETPLVKAGRRRELLMKVRSRVESAGAVIIPWGHGKKGVEGWSGIPQYGSNGAGGFDRALSSVAIGGNYAIRCDGCIVIDVDAKPKNADAAQRDMYEFADRIRAIETYQHLSQSGNPHAFFLKDARCEKWCKTGGVWGFVDVMTGNNSAVVGAGCMGDYGEYKVFKDVPIAPMPDWLFEELDAVVKKREEAKPVKPVKPIAEKKPLDVQEEIEKVKVCLSCISPNGYDKWVRILFCIKDVLGDTDEAYDIADEWSSRGDTYNKRAFATQWTGVKVKNKYTIGTLIYEAKQENLERFQAAWKWNDRVKSYKDVKAEFEVLNCKVNNPVCFVEVTANGAIVIRNREGFLQRYENLSCSIEKTNKKGDVVEEVDSFTKHWLKDSGLRTYERMDFIPPPMVCPADTYNTWQGIAAEKMDEVSDDVSNAVEELVDFMRTVLASGREDVFQYLLRWTAHMYQEPGARNKIALVLTSEKEGCGKTFFTNVLGKLFGYDLYYETNMAGDYFSQFCEARLNKMLCCFNEVSQKQVDKDAFKGFITDDQIKYERKGVPPIMIRNNARYIITSNNDAPIVIGQTDRRFFALSPSTCKANVKPYWTRMWGYLNRPNVLRGFYDYLMKVVIPVGYDWDAERPKTEEYEEIRARSLPLEMYFLADLVGKQAGASARYTARELFDAYQVFLQRGHFTRDLNAIAFGRIIGKFKKIDGSGVEEGRDMNTKGTRIVKATCIQWLTGKGIEVEVPPEFIEENTDSDCE